MTDNNTKNEIAEARRKCEENAREYCRTHSLEPVGYLMTEGFGASQLEKFTVMFDISLAEIAEMYHRADSETRRGMLAQYRTEEMPTEKPGSMHGVVSCDELFRNPPELAPALIDGILRQRHKMLVSAASKAGKSYLMIELAVALAEGDKWLGYQCKQCRVLYLNFEIDAASFAHRIFRVYEAKGITHTPGMLYIMNYRGRSAPLSKLSPEIIETAKRLGVSVIVFDPLYKILMGDENSAADMGKLCCEFDRIATETGCAPIYVHHHSKGMQGGKAAMDRYSGSGVMARDADALIDMTEIDVRPEVKEKLGYYADTPAFRVESTLREFAPKAPLNVFFDHPLHTVTDSLEVAEAEYKDAARQQKINADNGIKKSEFDEAYNKFADADGKVSYKDVAEELSLSTRTVKRYIEDKYRDEYEKCSAAGYFKRKTEAYTPFQSGQNGQSPYI